MSRPTDDVHWATDGGASVAEPSSGRKDVGWSVDEKPPADWFNWMQRGYGRWITHLSAVTSSLRVTNWVSGFSGTSGTLIAPAYVNNQFVIAGDAALIYSADGFNWVVPTFANSNSNVVYFANGLYLVGGSVAELATSTDLDTWTSRTSQFSTDAINSIAFGASIYVIAGATGKISSSPTGATWTARTSQFSTDTIKKVVFANSIFVAAGNAGKISTSTDGITWTARTSQFGSDNITDLVFANGVFVAVGVAGKISTSTDGITWTARTSQFSTTNIQTVVWNGTYFFALGSSGKISRSLDGITWTALTAITQTPTLETAVVSDDGLIVATINSSTDIVACANDTNFFRIAAAVPGRVAAGGGLFFSGGASGAVKTTGAFAT